MGNLSQLTSREAVLAAVHEFDAMGRDAFLDKYESGKSTKFFLSYRGRLYDSKAIVRAAWCNQFRDDPYLPSFGGGPETIVALERLGFEILEGEYVDTTVVTGVNLPKLRAAFDAFRSNPIEKVRVKLRRIRAKQIRDAFAAGAYREPEPFERGVWRMETEAWVNDEDWVRSIYSDEEMTPDYARQLDEALDSGHFELEGNFIWREGTKKFAPRASDEERLETLATIEQILTDPTRSPQQRVIDLKALSGIGWGVATGLGMIFHPEEVSIYNAVCPDLAAHVGASVSGRDGYQQFAATLKEELGCDDYLELDWFLYQLVFGHTPQADPAAVVAPRHLNTIFYGPPGTGKTFLTAARAVEIVDGKLPDTRDDVMLRLKQLRETNQIAFVTFHQSYSYEEFVEGIRPVLASDEASSAAGNVEYECRPGIFRVLCDAARAAPKVKVGKVKANPAAHRIWKLSLGNTHKAEHAHIFDDAIQAGYALLGWGGTVDFTGANDLEAVFGRLREAKGSSFNEAGARFVHRFKNEMAAGDLIVVSDGNRKFRAIGRVRGDYEFLQRDDYAQARPVEWLRVLDPSQPTEQIMRRDFSQQTFYELKHSVLKLDALRELLTEDSAQAEVEAPQKNYVLIIDEINRGNVAKILGELITLLEPDKRLGAPNEVRVKLPYSQEEFGVPSNLYVIGTMNTADRSIAFLDTALRRRFRFEEMMPDTDVIRDHLGDDGVVQGVDVAELVETLNRRIELLYDRDHTLGHAFFLGIETLEDLRDVFLHKVLPLLQEYFYDDWEKICAIAGCAVEDGAINGDHAVITAELLSGDELLPGLVDVEEKVRFSVNPDFLDATDDELTDYFLAMADLDEA